MRGIHRGAPEAWIPIAAGILWLWWAASFGFVGFVFSLVPGCLLLASGVSTLLWPGDIRVPQFGALGGMLGIPFAVPVFFVAGPGTGAVLVLLSAASWLAAGLTSIRQEPEHEDVPVPRPSAPLAAKVALDDTLLASWALTVPRPRGDTFARIRAEVHEALALSGDRGWIEKPETFHRAPPPLDGPNIRSRNLLGLRFEHVRFESEYEPEPEEPGRDRWLAHSRNRTAHAWVLRHEDEGRPWILCLHGYQMGDPSIDLRVFDAHRLHRKLGLNVMLPVLPLHGPRKSGWRSGDGFFGDYLDTIHAEAQSMWDLRRLLSWIRRDGRPAVGAYGLSLGGYNVSLLAALDDELSCVVAGIPATDFAHLGWRLSSPLEIRHAEKLGVVRDDVQLALSVVSPLALRPRVPFDGRYIFGGAADRIVTPDQVRNLWEHWERPRIVWYEGSHLSFRREPEVRSLLRAALTRLLESAESGRAESGTFLRNDQLVSGRGSFDALR